MINIKWFFLIFMVATVLGGCADSDDKGQQALTPPATGEKSWKGMYVAGKEGAFLIACDNGVRYRAEGKAEYERLKKAYMQEPHKPGQPLLSSVQVSFVSQNEPGKDVSLPSVNVEQFYTMWPIGVSCTDLLNVTFSDTYWQLTEIEGRKIIRQDRQLPHLIFSKVSGKIKGSSGCNGLSGMFELNGENIKIGRIAGTMMACPSGMELERRFLEMLAKVTRYKLVDDHLILFQDKVRLAEFKVVFM